MSVTEWDARAMRDTGELIRRYLCENPPPEGTPIARDIAHWSIRLEERGLWRLEEMGLAESPILDEGSEESCLSDEEMADDGSVAEPQVGSRAAYLSDVEGEDQLVEFLTHLRAPLLTLEEVCERVKLSSWALRRAIKRGELVAFKPAGRIRISEQALEDWLTLTRVEPDVREDLTVRPLPTTIPHASDSFRASLRKRGA
jgi:excisionase family DNA binding protein